jgi:hypothetical protein
MAEFRLCLSAVRSEFAAARDTLATSLRAREMHIAVQSDFRRQEASDTTLRKLHDDVRDCNAVVCVMGTRSGRMPAPTAAAQFAHMLPAGIARRCGSRDRPSVTPCCMAVPTKGRIRACLATKCPLAALSMPAAVRAEWSLLPAPSPASAPRRTAWFPILASPARRPRALGCCASLSY